jgi:hypothetical protein
MENKLRYKLVTGSTPSTCMDNVTDALAKGWMLYGSPFFAEGRYVQAMTFFDATIPVYDFGSVAVRELENAVLTP